MFPLTRPATPPPGLSVLFEQAASYPRRGCLPGWDPRGHRWTLPPRDIPFDPGSAFIGPPPPIEATPAEKVLFLRTKVTIVIFSSLLSGEPLAFMSASCGNHFFTAPA